MTDLVGGLGEGRGDAVLGVAVNAVRADPAMISAMASGQGWPGSRVPWSHIIMGKSTRTPRR